MLQCNTARCKTSQSCFENELLFMPQYTTVTATLGTLSCYNNLCHQRKFLLVLLFCIDIHRLKKQGLSRVSIFMLQRRRRATICIFPVRGWLSTLPRFPGGSDALWSKEWPQLVKGGGRMEEYSLKHKRH